MHTDEKLMRILDTGIALSKEKDRNRLLDRILSESMKIANCDAGTLYTYQDDHLHFKVMKTLSMHVDKGGNGERIDLPPVPVVPENICAYTLLCKKPLNIPDVYASREFDFSGPIRYDQMTHYHTQSMLTIPLLNQEDEVVGVMQLINALDETGRIVPFPTDVEHIILSLVCQAAIAMSNIRYMEEIKAQMWSFTEAMAEAIDARTPYNASHVRNVAFYAGKLADYINELHRQGLEEVWFSENRKEQLVLAALLHDLGKMAVPTRVMNKATRLEEKLETIRQRFRFLEAKYEIQRLSGRISQEECAEKCLNLKEILALVTQVNQAGFLPEEKQKALEKVLDLTCRDEKEEIPYFTQEEKEDLLIQKGTLTRNERAVMESHVEMTERILSKVRFNGQYAQAPIWAVQHHECLNGKGYPRGLTGGELGIEARILAVADICDALLATDRPYKKPLPREKAFEIMHCMAEDGSIDQKLVGYLEQCI